MKKLFLVLICFILVLSMFSCGSDNEQANEYSRGFISAMLMRDEAEMEKYLHPDFAEKAMPDDDFYNSIEENYFFTVGNELTAMFAIGESDFAEGVNDIEGEQTVYKYTIFTNELYYDVDLRILENDNGYGIVGFSFALNTNPDLYIVSEGE